MWLLEHLLPPNEMIKGCELIFPDTVFFEKGKAKVIIRMDKEFCLQANKNPTKLQKENIYRDFYNTVRERRKANQGIFQQKYPGILT